ncbi:holin [Wielerella bovis]|uniref:holin n=1 Tax=Wielerella bovis TaxID=2917790 RepID=UPI0020196C1D|nr:holin [Wielerella bovis]MCG7657108.1 hypothetical protein [Wielerella bovis]MCG7659331.1 hypothetical protein [Wielerella bovis]
MSKTTITNHASDVMYGGAGTSFAAWFAGIDWLSFIGFLVAVGGFIINAYAKYKENRLREAEHRLIMQRIQLEIQALENRQSQVDSSEQEKKDEIS